LAEAYTGASKTTDLGFSYSVRGEVTDVYQSSPHSVNYYHVNATYWANGLQNTLNANLSPLPTWTYAADGEGRWNGVSASAGQNPVSSTSYQNYFSMPTAVTFGSADSDDFYYDAKTGRMIQSQANVASYDIASTLTWNKNGSVQALTVTDAYKPANNQTCSYSYDDLARLGSVGCGSGNWSQTFTYDAFGNINKSGSQSFSLPYTATTNQINSTNYTYDANGNLLKDNGTHTYGWDAEGNLATLDSNTETYDALSRRVEQSSGGVYTEILYAPNGAKLALMSGQTVTKMFVPLPAAATAVYAGTTLSYYRYPDWLGSSRVASTSTRTIYYDGSYAPFGESYNESGTTDRSFTGQNQDLGAVQYYDFLYREHNVIEGRWISPDPAGMAAVDPTLPQTWNRYAYVANDPLNFVDPFGLQGEPSGSNVTVTDENGNPVQGATITSPLLGATIVSLPTGNQPLSMFFQWIYDKLFYSAGNNGFTTFQVTTWGGGGQTPPKAQTTQGIQTSYTTLVVPNAPRLVGKKVYGSGTCVALAKAFGAPQTALWKPGPPPDANTPPGTLCATFYANDGQTFANKSGFSHVGALAGVTEFGVNLIDQYSQYPTIQLSPYQYGATRNYNANGSNYFIVLVPHR
jgi:RHS repeat-associated protein